MSNLLANRLADSPVMISSDRALWAQDCLAAASAEYAVVREKASGEQMALMDDFWPEPGDWRCAYRPYTVTADGTLLVPVKGMLLHDFPWALGDWATGYPYVERAVRRGMEDQAVKRIALVINSGGGEVAGNFDMVDRIYKMRGTKPIAAMVNEHAYSAAYSIASCADKVFITRTGGVGSIGVVTSHVDVSAANAERGVKITFIHAGKHKVDGNPHEKLSDDVKNRMQARIYGLYDVFVRTVSRNLGVDEQVIRGTEALTYSADEAITLGLAHEVMAYDDALIAFGGSGQTNAGEFMSEKTQAPAETAAVDLDAAKAEGRKEGAQAERERIQAILGCDEAANRSALAYHLALNTDQSVDSAKGILAASPEVKAEAPKAAAGAGAFEEAMSKNNPELGTEQAVEVDAAAELIANYRAATGYGA